MIFIAGLNNHNNREYSMILNDILMLKNWIKLQNSRNLNSRYVSPKWTNKRNSLWNNNHSMTLYRKLCFPARIQ